MEKSFTDDKAFRVLLVVGLFGILFWSTYGHVMAAYEDSITATFGSAAWEDGIRMGHLHGLSNSIAATAAAIALPLIKSIRTRLKTVLALVLGLTLVLWNLGYTYAVFTTTAPTDEAFETALSTATNWILIPFSMLASLAGGILFVALLYDLIKKK